MNIYDNEKKLIQQLNIFAGLRDGTAQDWMSEQLKDRKLKKRNMSSWLI